MSYVPYFEHHLPPTTDDDEVVVKREAWITEIKKMVMKCLKSEQSVQGSLYIGAAGIVYMCCRVLQCGFLNDLAKDIIEYAKTYIKQSTSFYKDKDMKTKISFFFGYAGICFTSGLFYHIIGDENSKMFYINEYADLCIYATENQDVLDYDLLTGISGLLCGAAEWEKKMHISVIDTDGIKKISQRMIEVGKMHAAIRSKIFPICYPCHGTVYIGAAHGLSSAVQMLMSFDAVLQNEEQQKTLKKCVDAFCFIQDNEGNFVTNMEQLDPSMKKRKKEKFVQWCHGASGVIYLLARAYVIWKEPVYLRCCEACGELIWKQGLLRKGAGLCHGIAGNAYASLLLYRLTQDKKYLYRAVCFAEYLYTEKFRIESRIPDHPHSLFEGMAGTVCFLVDLLNASDAEFPFFDVFKTVKLIL